MRRFLTVRAALLSVAALVVAAAPASAATIQYSDRATWESLTSGLTNRTFEENGTGVFTFHSGGGTFDGVSFTDNQNLLFTVDPAFSSQYDWNSNDVLDSEGTLLTILLPAGTTSFGFDFMTSDLGTATVTLSTGEVFFVTSLAQPNRAFAGFISTSAVASLTIARAPNSIQSLLDNFAVGQASPVPEPASLLLLGAGATALAARRRRK